MRCIMATLLLIAWWPVAVGRVAHFYGDQSLWAYLKQLCATWNHIIVVQPHQYQESSPLHAPLLPVERFHSINCPVEYHNTIDSDYLAFRLNHYRCSVLVDFEPVNGEASFTQTFTQLSNLYAKCPYCTPFILMLRTPAMEQIEQWTQRVLEAQTRNHFEVILLSLQSVDRLAQVAHLDPILDGCHRHKGLYVPKSRKDFERLKTPVNECNLNGTTLDIAVNQSPPVCEFATSHTGLLVPLNALDLNLLELVMTKYHFTASYHDCANNWGRFVNGHWTGAVGMLLNQTADVAICSLAYTHHRAQYIDFSVTFYIDGLGMLSRQPGLRSRKWILLKPFTWPVWLLLLTSYAAILLTLELNYRYQGSGVYIKTHRSTGRFVATKLLAILVNQSGGMAWKETGQARLLYALWLLSTVILTTIYSGFFYSFLSLPKIAHQIDTVNDLLAAIHEQTHVITVPAGSAYLDLFLQATPDDPTMHLIGQYFNRTRNQSATLMAGFELVERNPQVIFIIDRLTSSYYVDQHATVPLHIGSDSLALSHFTWGFPKRSPLRRAFNLVIQRLLAFGLVKQITQRLSMQSAQHRSPHDDIHLHTHALALSDLQTIFGLWGVGMLLASSAFAYELFVWQAWCNWKH